MVLTKLVEFYRSKMPWEMSMARRRISLEKRDWPSPRSPILPSMSVSTILWSLDVCIPKVPSTLAVSLSSNTNESLKLDSSMNPSRHVELDIDIGADARDWSAIQAAEKLKPVETELRRIEELVTEIVNEMEYLRSREQKLRDTNESTNERVKWFALGTMGMLVGLGAWQVVYLRAYFRLVFIFHKENFGINGPSFLAVVLSSLCKILLLKVRCLIPYA